MDTGGSAARDATECAAGGAARADFHCRALHALVLLALPEARLWGGLPAALRAHVAERCGAAGAGGEPLRTEVERLRVQFAALLQAGDGPCAGDGPGAGGA